ncbi:MULTISPECIES: ribosome biogenesis GTPase Der [unclassified Gilliamella]|uniref:ribosome biogenesis GTPase Der n=1 Tax=unclassified Gilliamella TaxID=2685620 RepID=UPI00226A8677|nr:MULTISPECIES: ribosome biogenesis GTPase Der [unclassified Gilliamella]MCX8574200.1 ribosome biogenesis GTPase Der [Gilliamella sp. B3831]MCX8576431.1 ribosome biogenesis GTPase Der [Gilliamella sp. B3815]MCX8590932.1 ribosome biogenesis GTPase Der [Gilliamella sp. B3812]MCX8603682.1 ribosome biogenesis GTPase Der [Gilliamella sp. B3823]MCX8606074.1 ribosome biogenesis GTPase Der [Gilliamella sp. B3825]
MVPVVALVGRPNVGKSTLFNRLTRTRDALVADFPGLTRDRKYGRAEIKGHEYIVIDTGGIDGTEEGVESFMADQSLQAIEEADIVLFLVDARAGAMPADHAIAKHLRSRQKATFLVANKIDGIDADTAISDFYSLGLGDIHPIAASHGRGVSSLIETALEPIFQFKDHDEDDSNEDQLPPDLSESYDDVDEDDVESLINQPIKVAIVGRPNVGKSTLTNRILGEERVVVYDMPGTTRDSIYIPMTRDEREYVLIDTAGVRKRGKVTQTVEKFSVIKTLQAIEDANVVILVIDAREGISDQDLSLLGFIINSGRSLVIAVNKWDGLSQDIKEQVKATLDDRLDFIDFARLHFISALHGSGVGNLFDSIQEAYECATRRVNTALLTKIMQMAQDDHQPPLVRGRRVKLKYAHAGGYNPPIVVVHGNQVEDLPDSYKRYLMNYFRRSLKIMGTPIRIQFKEGANPFEGRKNSLTASQQRKRRRLMKHVRGRK